MIFSIFDFLYVVNCINQVILQGFLECRVRLRYFDKGRCVASFTLVTQDKFTHPKTKVITTTTQRHKIQVQNNLAEFCEENLQENDFIYLEGKLVNRYSEEMGLPRTDTYIYAHKVELIQKTPF